MGSPHPKKEPHQSFRLDNSNGSVRSDSPVILNPRTPSRSNSVSQPKPVQFVEGRRPEVTAAEKTNDCPNGCAKKVACLHHLIYNVTHDTQDTQLPSIPSTVPSLEGHHSDGLSDGLSIATEAGITSLDQAKQFLQATPMMDQYLNEKGDCISGLFAWGSELLREEEDETKHSVSRNLPSLHKSVEMLLRPFKTAELDTYRSIKHMEPLIVYGARTRISKHENEPWDLQSGLQATQPLRTPNRVRTKPSKSHSKKKRSSLTFLNAIEDQVHSQDLVLNTPFTQPSTVALRNQKEVGDMTAPIATPSLQNHKGYSSTFEPTPKFFQQMNPSSTAQSDPSGSSPSIEFGSVFQGIETQANYENTTNIFHYTPNQATPYPEVVNESYSQTHVPYENRPFYTPSLGARESYSFTEFYEVDNTGLLDIVATGVDPNSPAFQSSPLQDRSSSRVPSLLADESSPLSGASAIDSLSNHSGPSKGLEHHGSVDPTLLPIELQPTWSLGSLEPAIVSRTRSSEEPTNFDDYSHWIDFKAASNK